jgi:hypothetical protein
MTTHTDWTAYDAAMKDHNQNAALLLHMMIGANHALTREDAARKHPQQSPEHRRARAWDAYAERIAAWQAERPTYNHAGEDS